MNLVSYKTGPIPCPNQECDQIILAATPVSNEPRGMKNGMISVCSSCHSIMRFQDGKMILLKKHELKRLPPETKRILNITINKLRKMPKMEDSYEN